MAIKTVKRGTMEYLAADGIAAPHAFTTRLGGVSAGHLASLNIALHREDKPENVAENYAYLAKTIGFDLEKLVLAHQVHGDTVQMVTEKDCRGIDHHLYPECDGLITATPGVTLVVFTADCTPILLSDPVTGAVGAVHAGWRGTAYDIAGKAVRKMEAEFGCRPENIRAAIGPNIGPCCFRTDSDVPEAMVETFGPAAEEFIRANGEKFYVNLKSINALALRRAGVERIDISTECTMCSPEKYWSHRYTRGKRGSQGALIVCKGGAR